MHVQMTQFRAMVDDAPIVEELGLEGAFTITTCGEPVVRIAPLSRFIMFFSIVRFEDLKAKKTARAMRAHIK